MSIGYGDFSEIFGITLVGYLLICEAGEVFII
jgi:hypothetical protein